MASEVAAKLRCCSSCRAVYRSDFTRCPTDGALLALVDTDPLLGAVIGEHYVIDACVGEGAMGRVYRAHHRRLEQRTFAIKVMLGDWAATMAMRLRFAHEAETASRLSHPHVVPVVDFGRTDEGLLYLAMEYVEGRSLSRVIADEGPLAPARVVRLARQMCLGLGHAHGLGLVHRDFKPDNVLVVERDGEETVRIVDFGLAISRDLDTDVRLTAAGIAVGTPIYAAPEQTIGDPGADHRADLFSLGVSLYEMLAGTPPFDGNVIELIHHNATGGPPAMASRGRVEVPALLETLVRRLMSPTPSDRYATAAAVVETLDQLSLPALALTSIDPSIGGQPAQSTPPLTVPRRRSVAVPWVSVLGLAVTAVVWMRSSSTDAPRLPASIAATQIPALPEPLSPPAPVAPPPMAAQPGSVSNPVPIAAETRPAPRSSRAPASHRAPASRRAVERVTAPASVIDANEPVTEPPPQPPAGSPSSPQPTPPQPTPPIPAPAPAPPVITAVPKPLARAAARLDSLTVGGSLATSDVRRALDRVQPSLLRCYEQIASAAPSVVAVRFTINEGGKIAEIRIGGAAPVLASCVSAAIARVRPQSPPDVGTVAVAFDLTFGRGSP